MASDDVRHHDALFRRFVRQHRTAYTVTDGVDARHVGAALVVHEDEATLVQLDAHAIGHNAFGIRTTADTYDQLVEGHLLIAVGIGVLDDDFVTVRFRTGHTGTQFDVQPLLLEQFLGLFGNRGVDHRQEGVHRFQHGDFRTQTVPYAAQLQADDARANDAKTLRRFLEFQCAGGIDD